MDDQKALADLVAKYELASEVHDLDTARRFITGLTQIIRQMMMAAEEESTTAPKGRYVVTLDDEHEHKLQILYNTQRLGIREPTDPYWDDVSCIEEAMENFVHGALDIDWDAAGLNLSHLTQTGITLSA